MINKRHFTAFRTTLYVLGAISLIANILLIFEVRTYKRMHETCYDFTLEQDHMINTQKDIIDKLILDRYEIQIELENCKRILIAQ